MRPATPPRARPGAGQAGGRARSTGAAAPARRAAPDRPRVGDAAAPGPRRLRRARGCARPAHRTRRSPSTATDASERIPLAPDRPVGEVTREVLAAVAHLVGPSDRRSVLRRLRGRRRSTRTTSTPPTTPRRSRRTSRPRRRPRWCWPRFARPYRGRATPVNAWWGTFDLAVSLFSGRAGRAAIGGLHRAEPADAETGRGRLVARRYRYPRAAFYAFALPLGVIRASRRCHPERRAGTPARRVHPRLGRRSRLAGPTRSRAGIRPVSRPACLHSVRVGPRSRSQHGRRAAAHYLTAVRVGRAAPATTASRATASTSGATRDRLDSASSSRGRRRVRRRQWSQLGSAGVHR